MSDVQSLQRNGEPETPINGERKNVPLLDQDVVRIAIARLKNNKTSFSFYAEYGRMKVLPDD